MSLLFARFGLPDIAREHEDQGVSYELHDVPHRMQQLGRHKARPRPSRQHGS